MLYGFMMLLFASNSEEMKGHLLSVAMCSVLDFFIVTMILKSLGVINFGG